MDNNTRTRLTALQLLERMFEVEMKFIRLESNDVEALAKAFHSDVVVHEPASLPYPGDWKGLEGVGALFGKMREVWSDMRVDDLTAAREGDTAITQPFVEVLRFQDERLIEGTPFYYDTSEIVSALG